MKTEDQPSSSVGIESEGKRELVPSEPQSDTEQSAVLGDGTVVEESDGVRPVHEVAPQVAPPEVLPAPKAHESWPHDDVRRLVRAFEYCASRQVGIVMRCRRCHEGIGMVGVNNGGASLLTCGCTERVWW